MLFSVPKKQEPPPSPLAKAREAAKLTQVQMAERIGADPSSLSRWETGKAEPDIEHALRLLLELGVRDIRDAMGLFKIDAARPEESSDAKRIEESRVVPDSSPESSAWVHALLRARGIVQPERQAAVLAKIRKASGIDGPTADLVEVVIDMYLETERGGGKLRQQRQSR